MNRKVNRMQKGVFRALAAILLVVPVLFSATPAQAAQVTSLKAVFDRLKASTPAEGITITFASPTGIQTGGNDTISLTFSSGFTLAAEAAANFDVGLGNSADCSTATYTDETVALSNSLSDWGVDVTGQVITFTPEADDTMAAGFCVKFELGNDATTGGTGSTSTVTNGPIGSSDTITVGGAFADTGTIAVDIVSDDQVSVTATVDPTITFTISDNTVGFGSLSAATGRWANGAATGDNASATTPTEAHQMTIATNAQSGYVITYNGATLTSGSNTIDVATVDEDSDGSPGTEQFGLAVSTNGNATIATNYLRDSVSDFNFVASTTTTIVSETVPTATETLSVSYLANITGSTQAGAYSTLLTYIATATF